MCVCVCVYLYVCLGDGLGMLGGFDKRLALLGHLGLSTNGFATQVVLGQLPFFECGASFLFESFRLLHML